MDLISDELKPWQVSIIVNGKVLCSGTIMNIRTILTAAQCFDDEGAPVIQVKTVDLQKVTVGKIIKHEKYSKKGQHDIALLLLKEPLTFSHLIKSIAPSDTKFDKQMLKDKRKTLCFNIGHDQKKDKGEENWDRSEMTEIFSGSKCKKKQTGKTGEDTICHRNKNSKRCSGKPGAAFVCVDQAGNPVQVGLQKVHSSNCKSKPTVHTRVSTYRDWIEENSLYSPLLLDNERPECN